MWSRSRFPRRSGPRKPRYGTHLFLIVMAVLWLIPLLWTIYTSLRPKADTDKHGTFTIAHSLTFILAALDIVHVPAWFVEPVIALSIAIVAGLHLWRLWWGRHHPTDLETTGHGLLGFAIRKRRADNF